MYLYNKSLLTVYSPKATAIWRLRQYNCQIDHVHSIKRDGLVNENCCGLGTWENCSEEKGREVQSCIWKIQYWVGVPWGKYSTHILASWHTLIVLYFHTHMCQCFDYNRLYFIVVQTENTAHLNALQNIKHYFTFDIANAKYFNFFSRILTLYMYFTMSSQAAYA